jgi:hypothetical protein
MAMLRVFKSVGENTIFYPIIKENKGVVQGDERG